MLSIKTRKKYLKNLGFYNGKIDNKNTADYRKAVLNLQKKYFPKSEQDGRYGNNTEILLRNAERVRLYCKNFTLEELACECGGKYCTKYQILKREKVEIYNEETDEFELQDRYKQKEEYFSKIDVMKYLIEESRKGSEANGR